MFFEICQGAILAIVVLVIVVCAFAVGYDAWNAEDLKKND